MDAAQVTLHHGDCLDVLRTLPAASVDAVVTDPPYELAFMGRQWDSTGISYSVELWTECLRVLKPGGHLAAFGGTRTYHRMACAIEDAGFEIRDSISWLYGQGFPKNKTQLKPAQEPIVLARAPFRGSLAANVATHGTGSINVDATRIPHGADVDLTAVQRQQHAADSGWHLAKAMLGTEVAMYKPGGRWPANVVIDELVSADLGDRARYFYSAKAPTAERPKVNGVAHPTCKPLALMRWLVRLVTPQGGTIVDPFAGSGTTLEAAMLEGFHVIGIEREANYLPLIEHRITRARATLTAAAVVPDDPGLFDVPA